MMAFAQQDSVNEDMMYCEWCISGGYGRSEYALARKLISKIASNTAALLHKEVPVVTLDPTTVSSLQMSNIIQYQTKVAPRGR